MSDVNPDPGGHAYYQASDGKWYAFDQAPTLDQRGALAPDSAKVFPLVEARELRLKAAELRTLAGFFQFLGWATVAIGIVAGIAIAQQSGTSSSFSSSTSDYTATGLFTGAAICVSGLWLVLLARCADVLARHTALHAIRG